MEVTAPQPQDQALGRPRERDADEEGRLGPAVWLRPHGRLLTVERGEREGLDPFSDRHARHGSNSSGADSSAPRRLKRSGGRAVGASKLSPRRYRPPHASAENISFGWARRMRLWSDSR